MRFTGTRLWLWARVTVETSRTTQLVRHLLACACPPAGRHVSTPLPERKSGARPRRWKTRDRPYTEGASPTPLHTGPGCLTSRQPRPAHVGSGSSCVSLLISATLRVSAFRSDVRSYGLRPSHPRDSLRVIPHPRHQPLGPAYLQTSTQGLLSRLLMIASSAHHKDRPASPGHHDRRYHRVSLSRRATVSRPHI